MEKANWLGAHTRTENSDYFRKATIQTCSGSFLFVFFRSVWDKWRYSGLLSTYNITVNHVKKIPSKKSEQAPNKDPLQYSSRRTSPEQRCSAAECLVPARIKHHSNKDANKGPNKDRTRLRTRIEQGCEQGANKVSG